MKKNRVRLTESQLHRVIKESVKKLLREFEGDSCSKLMYDSDEDEDWYEFESLTHSYSEYYNFTITEGNSDEEREEYTTFSDLLSDLCEGATTIEIYRNNSRTEFLIIVDKSLRYFVSSNGECVNR